MKSENKKKTKLILNLLAEKSLKLVVIESCTGGLISSTINSVPGSSRVFEYGLITYSNKSKIDLLKVSKNTLRLYGAVSKKVSIEMVKDIANKSKDEKRIFISVTGIAGPSGGSKKKPIGTVYTTFAIKKRFYSFHKIFNFRNRVTIQKKIVVYIFSKLNSLLSEIYDKKFSGL